MKTPLNEIKRMQKLAGILNENFDHEMDAYRNDPKFYMDLKAKEKEGPVKSAADSAPQNYDDYMDNAYGKDRYGMTNEDDSKKNGFTVKLLKGGKFEISKSKKVLSPEEIKALTPKEKDEIAGLKKKAYNDAQWGDSSTKIKIGDKQAPSSDDEDYWE